MFLFYVISAFSRVEKKKPTISAKKQWGALTPRFNELYCWLS